MGDAEVDRVLGGLHLPVDLQGVEVDAHEATTAGREEAPVEIGACLLYTSPSPRDRTRSRMPSSA